jgi:hypothetical protein
MSRVQSKLEWDWTSLRTQGARPPTAPSKIRRKQLSNHDRVGRQQEEGSLMWTKLENSFFDFRRALFALTGPGWTCIPRA